MNFRLPCATTASELLEKTSTTFLNASIAELKHASSGLERGWGWR